MANRITSELLYQLDIYNNFIESSKKAESQAMQFNEKLAEQVKSLNKIAEKLGTSAKDVTKLTDSYSKSKSKLTEYQKAEQQIINLQKRREQVTNEQRIALAKLRASENEANAEARESVKVTNLQEKAYEKLVFETNKAQLSFKRLAAQFGVNSKEAKQARAEFDKLDNKLREINQSAKDGKRDVGRYGDAIKETLGKFGGFKLPVSGGGEGGSFNLPSGGGGGMGGFQTLMKTAGKAGPIVAAATAVVGGLGAAVYSVNKEFDDLRNQVQKATGSIGDDLDTLTVSFAALEDTFSVDRSELLLAARVLKNTFDDIKDQDIARLLEQGFLGSANATGQLLDSVQEYSVQIKDAGGDAEDLFKILDASGKVGIYSDKGIDTVKEFGLRIREQTTATKDALKNAFGEGFTNTLLKGVSDGSITTIDAIKRVSAELKKIPETSAEAQTVIADVFGSQGEDAGRAFISTLKDINFETKFYTEENDKLTNINRERLDVEKQIASVQNDISKAVGENSTLGLIWQKILLGLNTALLWLVNTVTNFVEFVQYATSSFENFAKAMIGWIPGISLLTGELNKSTEALTAQQNAAVLATIEINKMIEAHKQEIATVKSLTQNLGTQNISRQTQIENILKIQKLYPDIIKGYNEENLAQADLLQIKGELLETFGEEFILRRKNYAQTLLQAELDRAINEGRSQLYIDQLNRVGEARITMFEDELRIQLGLKEREKVIEEEKADNSIDAFSRRVEGEKTKLDELEAFKKAQDTRLAEFENDLRRRGAYDDQLVADKKIELDRETGRKIIDLDLKDKSILINHENELLRYIESNSQAGYENRKRALSAWKKEYDKTFDEITDKPLPLGITEEDRINLSNYISDIEKLTEVFREFAETRLDNIDRQIELQGQAYDEARSNEEYLRDIAKERGLDASEAISIEREAQREALAAQEQLERKRQRAEAYIAGLNALANGESIQSISNKLGQLKGIVDAYFYTGTDTTIGAELGNTTQRDGHVIAVDGSEAIFNKTKTRALGIGHGRTTSDVVDIVRAFDNGMLYKGAYSSLTPVEVAALKASGFDSMEMIAKLEQIVSNTQQTASAKDSAMFDSFTGVLHYMKETKGTRQVRRINYRK